MNPSRGMTGILPFINLVCDGVIDITHPGYEFGLLYRLCIKIDQCDLLIDFILNQKVEPTVITRTFKNTIDKKTDPEFFKRFLELIKNLQGFTDELLSEIIYLLCFYQRLDLFQILISCADSISSKLNKRIYIHIYCKNLQDFLDYYSSIYPVDIIQLSLDSESVLCSKMFYSKLTRDEVRYIFNEIKNRDNLFFDKIIVNRWDTITEWSNEEKINLIIRLDTTSGLPRLLQDIHLESDDIDLLLNHLDRSWSSKNEVILRELIEFHQMDRDWLCSQIKIIQDNPSWLDKMNFIPKEPVSDEVRDPVQLKLESLVQIQDTTRIIQILNSFESDNEIANFFEVCDVNLICEILPNISHRLQTRDCWNILKQPLRGSLHRSFSLTDMIRYVKCVLDSGFCLDILDKFFHSVKYNIHATTVSGARDARILFLKFLLEIGYVFPLGPEGGHILRTINDNVVIPEFLDWLLDSQYDLIKDPHSLLQAAIYIDNESVRDIIFEPDMPFECVHRRASLLMVRKLIDNGAYLTEDDEYYSDFRYHLKHF